MIAVLRAPHTHLSCRPLDIVLSSKGGRIEGTVVNEQLQPVYGELLICGRLLHFAMLRRAEQRQFFLCQRVLANHGPGKRFLRESGRSGFNERVGIAEGVFVDQNQTPRSFVTRRLKSTPRNRRHNVFTDTTFSNIQTMSLWLAGS